MTQLLFLHRLINCFYRMAYRLKNFISWVDNCSWNETNADNCSWNKTYVGQCDWNSSLLYILTPIVIYALLIIAIIIILFCGCKLKSGWSMRAFFSTSIMLITIYGSIILAIADGSMLHLIFEITKRISVISLKLYKKIN